MKPLSRDTAPSDISTAAVEETIARLLSLAPRAEDHACLRALLLDRDETAADCLRQERVIHEQDRLIDRLWDALTIYADPQNWQAGGLMTIDRGRLAREALGAD